LVLENAGLVGGERRGQRVLYRINREVLVAALTELALEISPESRAPKKPRESI
jgi:DNA-binding transcriptional ArsR family regulator